MLVASNSIKRHEKWERWVKAFERKTTLKQREVFRKSFPSVLWAPNRAQERMFSLFLEEPFPRIALMTFGNGTGKTDSLGEFLAGAARGPKYVNPAFCAGKYFEALTAKRDAETLTIWWVCDADLMKKNGPDYKAILAHIPDAQFKARDNKGVYHEIHIPAVSSDGRAITTVVQVKTHGQGTSSYAGENVDLIICDEPPPEEHWGEMVGRLRSTVGEAGARIVIGGTPLKISAYLCDIVDDEDFKEKVIHLTGSTWENCASDQIPEKEITRLGIPRGKDGLPITRGHLTRESIEDQIMLWRKSSDPMELRSRIDGVFGHTLGKIYPEFSKDVHVIKPFPIPEHYPVLFYCDPHDARDDAGIWVTITPRNKMIVIGEYPNVPYELQFSRQKTIQDTCALWDEREASENWVVVRSFGDPNKLLDPDPTTLKRLHELYAKHGRYFNTKINDNLATGHERVHNMLSYDRAKHEQFPDDPMYLPELFIFDTCVNCINFMNKYGTVVPKDLSQAFKEQVGQKFKDFPDVIRYAAVTFKPYSYWKESMKGKSREWDSIKKARKPSTGPDMFKGRQVVRSRIFK